MSWNRNMDIPGHGTPFFEAKHTTSSPGTRPRWIILSCSPWKSWCDPCLPMDPSRSSSFWGRVWGIFFLLGWTPQEVSGSVNPWGLFCSDSPLISSWAHKNPHVMTMMTMMTGIPCHHPFASGENVDVLLIAHQTWREKFRPHIAPAKLSRPTWCRMNCLIENEYIYIYIYSIFIYIYIIFICIYIFHFIIPSWDWGRVGVHNVDIRGLRPWAWTLTGLWPPLRLFVLSAVPSRRLGHPGVPGVVGLLWALFG